jgi:HlyD family secretion protein
MAKLGSRLKNKKSRRIIIIAVAALAAVVFFWYRKWQKHKKALPAGIAAGNGRIEAKEVDVSSKLALRVKEVLVNEGDLVKPGQIVVQMDTITLESELAEAKQNEAAAREQMAVAKASMARSGSEIALAKIEKERSQNLVKERAGSQRELDVRTAKVKTTSASYAEEKAKLDVAEQQAKAAQAQVETIQSRIEDATLRSPVLGRVLYRLAEPGEVLAAGGKALTVVNLEDVYMEIFLPSNQAAALKVGDEARFKVDFEPNRVAPGFVSFVSPEAQFTPKQVETLSEREKLMFRVKIQVPKELVTRYIERIKTGVRGVGYVRTRENARWPESLERNLVAPPESVRPPAVSKTPSEQPPVEARPSPQPTRN